LSSTAATAFFSCHGHRHPECIPLQHLPDYNTWVKITTKTACCVKLQPVGSGLI
jgi:hypothetical protein